MFNFWQKILAIPVVLASDATDKSAAATQTAGQIENLAETFFRAIPFWITGGLVMLASIVIAKMVKTSVENKMSEKGLDDHEEVQIAMGRASFVGVLALGITVGLKIAGIDLTTIMAAAAFGIGFAMKDLIMNFIAGIIVLLQKQFTIGDWIKIGKTVGIIEAIQSRYTLIRNFDGTKVIIPNADLFKKQVTNLTSNQYRRFQFNLSVDLYYDLHQVIAQIEESAKKVKTISMVPRLPSVRALKPGPYYNNLRIRCWAISKKGVLKPQSDLIKQLHRDFYKRGWSWPYPTQSLILDHDREKNVDARAHEYTEHAKKHKQALHPIAPPNAETLMPSPQALAREAGLVAEKQKIEQQIEVEQPGAAQSATTPATAPPINVPVAAAVVVPATSPTLPENPSGAI